MPHRVPRRLRWIPVATGLAIGLVTGLAGDPVPPRGADAWSDPGNPVRTLWGGRRIDLWSLRPPVPRQPPAFAASHPVDRFLESAAAAAPGTPSAAPEASRRTRLRRLTFDLTGLPPDDDTVREFETDPRPDAWERQVDRLLASPAYGEHQARLWLDIIRYSDSNGFDWDEFRPQAWRFRDYVIRSFNDDKPLDRLILEHLAGDELVAGPPRDRSEQEALLGTGFLRLGPHDNAAPLFNEQARSRAELMADLVETTGSAFLGLTFSCCRCHDHKYDPLTQADHFRLRAFFEGVKFADDLPLDLAPRQAEIREHNAAIDRALEPLKADRDALREAVAGRLRQARIDGLPPEDRSFLETPESGDTGAEGARRKELEARLRPSDAEIAEALTSAEKDRIDAWDREAKELERGRSRYTTGLVMTDAGPEPPPTRILFQGDPAAPRDTVEPGFPSVFTPGPAPIRRPPNPDTSGRRLTLAQWITAPTNPWTARVFVNRVWQQHFGRGLVETPNDFGLAGERPTHPALLDWLACRFVSEHWSVKRLHRLLVTSQAYQRASAGPGIVPGDDPSNRRFLRQTVRRLDAEPLRDSLLSVAGMLLPHIGGPPVWPDLPPEILQANPAFLDDNAERTKGWYPSPPLHQPVRTLYLVRKRTVKVPFLETFDLPDNSVSCARRTESTVAPQALSLLNSPPAVSAARQFAARITSRAGDDPAEQIRTAFRLALQREPTDTEQAACRALLARRSLVELARVVLNLNEFVYLD